MLIALAVWQLPTALTGRLDSLPVLPFQTLGRTSGDEYLALGMADALITRLSTVRQLTVRPTSSVRPFIGTSDAISLEPPMLLPAAGSCGLGPVVDGLVQRLGGRIRISARLERVADGKPLWADTYDELFSDIFSVQDAVSAKIASALSITLSAEEEGRLSKRYGTNTEAHQFFYEGSSSGSDATLGMWRKPPGFLNKPFKRIRATLRHMPPLRTPTAPCSKHTCCAPKTALRRWKRQSAKHWK
jgi:TolB-like protein